jgi:CheY-like chemotaxis protein
LLVEDEPAVRELAALILGELGYSVKTAVNGIDALRHLQDLGANPFDLLVTDVVMPQMGGRELADRLQETRPGTKVLYISGYTEDAIGTAGILDAGTAFLQKPFTTVALSRKVAEVMRRDTAGSQLTLLP